MVWETEPTFLVRDVRITRYGIMADARSIVSCQISELKMPQHRLILVILLVFLTPEHFPQTKVLQH